MVEAGLGFLQPCDVVGQADAVLPPDLIAGRVLHTLHRLQHGFHLVHHAGWFVPGEAFVIGARTRQVGADVVAQRFEPVGQVVGGVVHPVGQGAGGGLVCVAEFLGFCLQLHFGGNA